VFEIGDMVCYPMHGVGEIESVQEQIVLGESARYYVLRFVMGKMTAMVPVATAETVGLRKLVCPDDCRDREKGLSAGERKMYLTARQVLIAELAASCGKEESEFLPLVGG